MSLIALGILRSVGDRGIPRSQVRGMLPANNKYW